MQVNTEEQVFLKQVGAVPTRRGSTRQRGRDLRQPGATRHRAAFRPRGGRRGGTGGEVRHGALDRPLDVRDNENQTETLCPRPGVFHQEGRTRR